MPRNRLSMSALALKSTVEIPAPGSDSKRRRISCLAKPQLFGETRNSASMRRKASSVLANFSLSRRVDQPTQFLMESIGEPIRDAQRPIFPIQRIISDGQ
jgi:hypothetical protein